MHARAIVHKNRSVLAVIENGSPAHMPSVTPRLLFMSGALGMCAFHFANYWLVSSTQVALHTCNCLMRDPRCLSPLMYKRCWCKIGWDISKVLRNGSDSIISMHSFSDHFYSQCEHNYALKFASQLGFLLSTYSTQPNLQRRKGLVLYMITGGLDLKIPRDYNARWS